MLDETELITPIILAPSVLRLNACGMRMPFWYALTNGMPDELAAVWTDRQLYKKSWHKKISLLRNTKSEQPAERSETHRKVHYNQRAGQHNRTIDYVHHHGGDVNTIDAHHCGLDITRNDELN